MRTLRINLHIRYDVSPRLHVALASMLPRPRAERLRKLAELGLQIESGQLHSLTIGSSGAPTLAMQASPTAPEASGIVTEEFGNDLLSLLDMTAIVRGENGTR